jgi:hypothetical protein
VKAAIGAALNQEATMKFILNLYGDESFFAEATPEQMKELGEQMNEYNAELEKAGVWVSGEGLAPSAHARTLRFGTDGKVVPTDGPFTETKEQVGGFWILECKDMNEAEKWASKAPIKGAVIEIRPTDEGPEENVEAYKEAQK